MRFRDRGSTRKVGMCELLLKANQRTALEKFIQSKRSTRGGRKKKCSRCGDSRSPSVLWDGFSQDWCQVLMVIK